MREKENSLEFRRIIEVPRQEIAVKQSRKGAKARNRIRLAEEMIEERGRRDLLNVMRLKRALYMQMLECRSEKS